MNVIYKRGKNALGEHISGKENLEILRYFTKMSDFIILTNFWDVCDQFKFLFMHFYLYDV